MYQIKSEWVKHGLIFDECHAQLPVADVYDDFIRIYFSTRIDKRSRPMFIDVDKSNPKNILCKSMNPILELGRPGTFDWAGVMPTAIVRHGELKYLYYIGWSVREDVPYHNNLGLAISNDNGNCWKKISEGPIFHTSLMEPGYIGTIDVLIEGRKWHGWYLSCRNWVLIDGKMEPVYDIKYATSQDGVNWTPSGITAIKLEKNEGGISAARVILTNNGFKMWFSVRNKENYRSDPNNSYRIKTATSMNGTDWVRNNDTEIEISKEGWDDTMTCYPYIISQAGEPDIMFYNGNGFGATGIGYAKKT
jgi:hypothetical protein